jgi:hypothetical protein
MPPTTTTYSDPVVDGIDASRRVAWAKFYDVTEYAELIERLLLDLIDAVLYERHFEAFARAWQAKALFEHYRAMRD